MNHAVSEADADFRRQFEGGDVAPADFDHRAHLRLAYIYLVESTAEEACAAMRDALFAFIQRNGIDPGKYHETITGAWIMAVRHFMQITGSCASADELIDRNPKMLDAKIMLSHYSAELLFSERARAGYVAPDIEPIPRYDD